VSRYKSLDELELAFQVGKGVAIICEGDDGGFDQRVFSEWAESLGGVTFVAQDGWQRVQVAVAELRRRGTVPVYGIIDRDCASDEVVSAQSSASYEACVYRLPRYDLEAYLLDPALWFRVLQRVLFRGEAQLPAAWDSVVAVERQILDLYRKARPVAAHNWAIHHLNQAGSALPAFKSKPYFESIRALQNVDPEQTLASHYAEFGAEREARAAYQERLSFLEDRGEQIESLDPYVSGKVVLDALYNTIPRARTQHLRRIVERYMDPYLDGKEPPADIATIVRRIIERAARERST